MSPPKRRPLSLKEVSTPALTGHALDRKYLLPPHIRFMSQAIAETVDKPDGRLILSAPPRCGKTTIAGLFAPIWFLERKPDRRVLYLSHDSDFSADRGGKIRDAIANNAHRLTVRLKPDKRAAKSWDTMQGGGFLGSGVGGNIMGRGTDLCLIDDITKSAKDARSATHREDSWEWYVETVSTRFEPGCSVVLLMHRWSDDDLPGRLLETFPGEWEYLSLAALAEDDDALGRDPGQPLWPERYDRVALHTKRRQMTSRAWSALYQQRPAPAGGDVFQSENFRYCRQVENRYIVLDGDNEIIETVSASECVHIQVADTALTEKQSSDWTVLATVARTPSGRILVLDIERERLSVPKQYGFLQAGFEKWQPLVRRQYVEERGSGHGLLQSAATDFRYPLFPVRADADKVSRAEQFAVAVERHRVHFLRDARWLDTAIAELVAFPVGRWDDITDALSYAVREIRVGNAYPGQPVYKPREGGASYRRDRQSYGESVPCADGYESIHARVNGGPQHLDGLSLEGRMRQIDRFGHDER